MVTGCSCQCHGGPGAYPPPCSIDGGCGPCDGGIVACAASGCRRPADPVLCAVDERRLGDWLAQLGTLYTELSAVPSMQGREPGTGGSSGLKSQRTPVRLDVVALRDPRTAADTGALSVLAVLTGWAELVRDTQHITPPPARATARMPGRHGPLCDHWCGHASCEDMTWRYWRPFTPTVASERKLLAAQLPWILAQEWAGAFFDEIRELWALLDRATNGPRPARAKRACPHCGGLVTVTAGVAACDGCPLSLSGLDLAQLGEAAA